MLSRGLRREAHVVEQAESRGRALAKLGDGSFELLLVDGQLPDGSGLELVSRYRAEGGAGGVIVLAGSQAEDRALVLERGADDVLVKPFLLGELRARIQALQRRLS